MTSPQIIHYFPVTLLLLFSPALTTTGMQSDISQTTKFYKSGLQFTHREVLDAESDTILEWTADPEPTENSIITFAFTTSWDSLSRNEHTHILFGLSITGHVHGSDVVAVKVGDGEDQIDQVVDMYGVNDNTLVPDETQNWSLQSVTSNTSHVSVMVSRQVNTCDKQDMPISNERLLRIIWGYGTPDDAALDGTIHFVPEGSKNVYLLDPIIPKPRSWPGNELNSWRISRKLHLPPQRTTYWCTVHRGPSLPRKHHIVSVSVLQFAPYSKDELSQRHIHHIIVFRCISPPGIDAAKTFQKYVGQTGEECHLEDRHQLPMQFCGEMVMEWGVGGKPFYFPNDVGLALGESENEYYILDTHYDNPDGRDDLVVENGIDFLYSPRLRRNEGSVMIVGYGQFGLFQLPPHVKRFTVAGSCSPQCTRMMIPEGGLQIIAGGAHAHTASRKISLRHFRGKKELPWIQSDHNYDFNYQQYRILPKPVTILPGDRLTTQCEMDTSSRNTTTLAGFGTNDEMCITFVVINKRIPYTYCTSEYVTDRTLARYGVISAIWNRERKERMVHMAYNSNLVGLPLTRVIDDQVGKWTPQKIRELEHEQLYQWHDAGCPNMKALAMTSHGFQMFEDVTMGLWPLSEMSQRFVMNRRGMSTPVFAGLMSVKYPVGVTPYVPPETCGDGKRKI